MDPVVYGPGAGEHHAGPAQIVIQATGEHTRGSFFLAESTLAPGFAGPPPHQHRELHDMFCVLEGTLTLRLGDRAIKAGPGGGPENYMRDLAEAAHSGPLTREVIARAASQYDCEFMS